MIFRKHVSSASSLTPIAYLICLVTLSLAASSGCTRAKKKPKASAAAAKKAPPEETKAQPPVVANPEITPAAVPLQKNFSMWLYEQIEANAIEIDFSAATSRVKAMLEAKKEKLKGVPVDMALIEVMRIAQPELKEQVIQLIAAALEKQCGHLGLFSDKPDAIAYFIKKFAELDGATQLKSEVLEQTAILVPQMEQAQMKSGIESELPSFRVLNLAAAELESIKINYTFDPKKLNIQEDSFTESVKITSKGLNKAFEGLLKEKMGASTVLVVQPLVLALQTKTRSAAFKMLEQQVIDIQKNESWISSIKEDSDLKAGVDDLSLPEVTTKLNETKQATLDGEEFKAYLAERIAEGKKVEDVQSAYAKDYDDQVKKYYPLLTSSRAKKFYEAGVRYLTEAGLKAEEIPATMKPLLPAWNWSRTPGNQPTPYFMYDVLKD